MIDVNAICFQHKAWQVKDLIAPVSAFTGLLPSFVTGEMLTETARRYLTTIPRLFRTGTPDAQVQVCH